MDEERSASKCRQHFEEPLIITSRCMVGKARSDRIAETAVERGSFARMQEKIGRLPAIRRAPVIGQTSRGKGGEHEVEFYFDELQRDCQHPQRFR